MDLAAIGSEGEPVTLVETQGPLAFVEKSMVVATHEREVNQ
jgi:hypothetical protein